MVAAGTPARSLRAAAICLCFAFLGMGPAAARAEPPSFDQFFTGVSECRLDMERFSTLIDAYGEGAVIALPNAGAMRGFLVDSFFVVPRHGQTPAQYGLLFNAPLEAVRQAFPEYAERATVNGHLRQLARLSEYTRTSGARRKTLLLCTDGIPV